MARRALRRRSGDIATTVQLADRTGIFAASAPPKSSIEVKPPERATDMLGRLRRYFLGTCAALALIGIGWVGGGLFGARHDDGDLAAVDASGSVLKQPAPSAAAPPPPVIAPTTETPKPPEPPVVRQQPVKKPATTTTRASSKPATSSTTPSSATPEVRTDSDEQVTSTTTQPVADLAGQLIGPWFGGPYYYYYYPGGNGYGYPIGHGYGR